MFWIFLAAVATAPLSVQTAEMPVIINRRPVAFRH
jgi:hypothetical protein